MGVRLQQGGLQVGPHAILGHKARQVVVGDRPFDLLLHGIGDIGHGGVGHLIAVDILFCKGARQLHPKILAVLAAHAGDEPVIRPAFTEGLDDCGADLVPLGLVVDAQRVVEIIGITPAVVDRFVLLL